MTLCHMAALGIRNLSPADLSAYLWVLVEFWFVRGYGSRCEDCVGFGRTKSDHFSAIRGVSEPARSAVVVIAGSGWRGYHSIPITLVGMVLQPFFLGGESGGDFWGERRILLMFWLCVMQMKQNHDH